MFTDLGHEFGGPFFILFVFDLLVAAVLLLTGYFIYQKRYYFCGFIFLMCTMFFAIDVSINSMLAYKPYAYGFQVI